MVVVVEREQSKKNSYHISQYESVMSELVAPCQYGLMREGEVRAMHSDIMIAICARRVDCLALCGSFKGTYPYPNTTVKGRGSEHRNEAGF